MNQQLFFVYNARSGAPHKVVDFLHKAISPATYTCSLCAITYGTFTIKKDWKAFVARLPIPAVFLYKNEVLQRYPHYQLGFPAILLQKGNELVLLIGASEMDKLELPQLMQVLRARLREHGLALDKSPVQSA